MVAMTPVEETVWATRRDAPLTEIGRLKEMMGQLKERVELLEGLEKRTRPEGKISGATGWCRRDNMYSK